MSGGVEIPFQRVFHSFVPMHDYSAGILMIASNSQCAPTTHAVLYGQVKWQQARLVLKGMRCLADEASSKKYDIFVSINTVCRWRSLIVVLSTAIIMAISKYAMTLDDRPFSPAMTLGDSPFLVNYDKLS